MYSENSPSRECTLFTEVTTISHWKTFCLEHNMLSHFNRCWCSRRYWWPRQHSTCYLHRYAYKIVQREGLHFRFHCMHALVRRGWTLLDDVRNRDVQLLNALGVTLISDLMVEKQKLKYGFLWVTMKPTHALQIIIIIITSLYVHSVSSSEKVEEWRRYSTAFRIASMPYPGSMSLYRDFCMQINVGGK